MLAKTSLIERLYLFRQIELSSISAEIEREERTC